MTALRLPLASREKLGFVAAVALGAVVGGAALPIQPNQASATVTIAPSVAASLIAATSGQHLIENRATGESARLINAAMPFSSAPVLPGRKRFWSIWSQRDLSVSGELLV